MLIAIKNGSNASHEFVSVPYSKFNHAIADCLVKNGYLKSVSKKQKKKFPVLEIGIAYNNNVPKINDVKRFSKLSKRLYLGSKNIKLVKSGHGSIILTTPKGVITGEEARKKKIGGEALFKIW